MRKEDPPKCALCEQNHPANYKGCEVYQEIRQNKYPQKARNSFLSHSNQQSNEILSGNLPREMQHRTWANIVNPPITLNHK